MPQLRGMTVCLKRLARDRRGATAIEYGLIVALIALSLVAGARGIGNQLTTTFNAASSGMSTPAS
jgi:pilus assembly protein Flp/PilA